MSRVKANAVIENRIYKDRLLERERIIIWIAVTIIIAFSLILFVLGSHYAFSGKNDSATGSQVITPLNVEGMAVSETSKKTGSEISSYEAVMNTTWFFTSGKTNVSSNVYIENSRYNSCPVRFTVSLKNTTDNVIYSSGILRVGEKIKEIKLDKTVPDGIYGAEVTYYMLDPLGRDSGSVKTNVTIYVGENSYDKDK